MRFPFYQQRDFMDCGPSCLHMIGKFYGRSIPIGNLREWAGITKEGVSLLGIADAAEKAGFESAALTTTADKLDTLPLPAILHWKQKHFVVLYKVKGDRFYIADPAVGKSVLSRDEFLSNWIGDPGSGTGIVMLLQPREEFYRTPVSQEAVNSSNWQIIKRYLNQYRPRIAKLLGCLLVGSLIQFTFPYLTQAIVDRGIRQQDLRFIQLILLAQFVLFFAQAFTEFIRARILLYISTHVNLSILGDFWAKLMRLPLHFFETKKTGDILQRINDHRRIELFITGSALQTIFSLFNLLVFSIVLLTYDPGIFSIFIAGSAVYFLWIRVFLKRRRILDHTRFGAAAKESAATMQLIYGMQEIKLNNAEKLKQEEWHGLQKNLFNLNFKSLSLNQYQQAGAFFINQGKNILITYLVAVAVLQGNMTLGQMLAIQYIIGQLNSPVEQLIQFVQQAQEARISLERLNEIHQLPDETSAVKQYNKTLPPGKGITIRDLSFSYPGAGNTPVLNGIDLLIPANKITAIVGMSGSGKTTLLKLLQKFYDQYTGSIRVGDCDLRTIDPSYWRSLTGSVMQDGFIFNGSIAGNIALAEKEPDPARLRHACRVAAISDFIDSLPLGFNTRIGAEGNGISSGQKQRLFIARAVYKDPQFLFFDEATNALDANNEKAIMENLQHFFRGRTVLIAAHRLSTVMNADKIVLIENGSIIEQGTHRELSRGNSRYYELVRNQLETLENSAK